MTSILLVEPVFFGSNPKVFKDNKFITASRVSESQALMDHSQAVGELETLYARVKTNLGLDCARIRLKNESRANRAHFDDKPDAIFPNNSVSFHNFVDEEGKIVRRVVILYPMSPGRQGELPKDQFLNKLEKATERGVEVVDLRDFQQGKKYLEGTGALNFSHDGKFVYMSLSTRSDAELLDIVCSEENLHIPPENRFIFSMALPRPQKEVSLTKQPVEYDTIYHTNVAGWVGKGICAWGLDFMTFESDEEKERFMNHIQENYSEVLNLSDAEIRQFAGNSLEVAIPGENEARVLFMSESGYKSLQRKNLRVLEEWYGKEYLIRLYADVIERRAGGSVRCLIAASITHGETQPAAGEESIIDVIGIKRQE